MDVNGQHHTPTAFSRLRTRTPIIRVLGGPQSRSGWFEKNKYILSLLGIQTPCPPVCSIHDAFLTWKMKRHKQNIFVRVFLPGIVRYKLAFLTGKSRGNNELYLTEICNQILHLFCPLRIWMLHILSLRTPMTESASNSRSEGCLTMSSIGPSAISKKYFLAPIFLETVR
jgi:hypothetical protein